jgi:hypothetical protein
VIARDSAGVAIIEAGSPPVEFAAWDGGPVLEIGVVEGERDYQFDRITGLARLSDGALVVADAGAHDVRAFGADGRLRWRTGRAGEGPGEFGGELALARLTGDTLAVYDWLQRRLTFLGPDGSVAGVAPIVSALPNLSLVGRLDAGTLLFSARHLRLGPGLNEDSVSYHAVDRDGTILRQVGASPGSRVFFLQQNGPPLIDEQPFGAVTAAATTDGGYALATGVDPEIRVRDADGSLRRIVRWNAAPQPITPANLDAWKAWDLARGEHPETARRLWQDAVTLPDHLPYATGLIADGERFWVREWSSPEEQGSRWRVLDPGEGWVAAFRLAAGLEPRLVADGWLIGVRRDELDVEHVVAYEVAVW